MDNKYFHILPTYLSSKFVIYLNTNQDKECNKPNGKVKFEGNKSRLSHNLIEHWCLCIQLHNKRTMKAHKLLEKVILQTQKKR
jgi:hypothetical protein